MAELSVIIPFVNEYPQSIFTIRNIAEELRDRVDFEILAVDNWCQEVKNQGREKQGDGDMIKSMSQYWPWLKYLKYEDRLSHWQAKNLAIQEATGKFFVFIDAHCIIARDALYKAFELYRFSHKSLDGTLHLPLTYHILEKHKLIYSLVYDEKTKNLHYRFCTYRDDTHPYEVPCMSTCGMIISRPLMDIVGGWPKNLGIYSGGEDYINFVLSILGKKKWIMPGGALCHHGAKRGYHWNGADYIKNRLIAVYTVCGKQWAEEWFSHSKGRPNVLREIWDEVMEESAELRGEIKAKQQIGIEKWLEKWGKE